MNRFATAFLNLCCVLLLFVFCATDALASNPIVQMQTTKGPIIIEIFITQAPNTANNFLDLVQRGFYNGLSFHRIENWCIQGGDPAGNGTGSFIDPATGQPRYLKLEITALKHKPFVIAMARSNAPNSASCQFYITKAQTPFLDGQYAVFGRVNGMASMQTVNAMEVGDKIISAKIAQPEGSASAPPQPSAPARDSGF